MKNVRAWVRRNSHRPEDVNPPCQWVKMRRRVSIAAAGVLELRQRVSIAAAC